MTMKLTPKGILAYVQGREATYAGLDMRLGSYAIQTGTDIPTAIKTTPELKLAVNLYVDQLVEYAAELAQEQPHVAFDHISMARQWAARSGKRMPSKARQVEDKAKRSIDNLRREFNNNPAPFLTFGELSYYDRIL